jgi:alkylhydroperoxidase family enzyme
MAFLHAGVIPMRLAVFLLFVSTIIAPVGSALAQSDAKSTRFPALGTDEAWKQIRGDNPPLPAWALALAQPLPRTTGAMLHLDYVHRAKNPLGPVLAGKLHWAAADAIGSNYSKRYAEADLKRAGVKDEDLQQLAGDPKQLPYPDRMALAFARKLTKAAYTVTDAEVAELLKEFGPEKVVAMVHTLAWANFQNRIILALGLEVEREGPLAPLDPGLDPERQAKLVAPERPPWKDAQAVATTADTSQPDWRKLTDAQRETALEEQKGRKPRIPLPKEAPDAKSPSKVVWTQVSSGYQPLLTQSWFDTMRTFQQEAKLDRVFANSYFWVITRTNECFY